jgi:hypothetical protein
MMKSCYLQLIILSIVTLTFTLSVPLKIKNSTGYNFNNAPAQAGIPLPEGEFTEADLSKFTVSEQTSKLAVPAGIGKHTVWHDGSLRWVKLIFPATVNNGETKYYVFSDADKNTAGGVSAIQSGNSVTVSTGPLKFTVNGSNFNIIDEAWMNETVWNDFNSANQVIETGNTGGFYIKGGSTEYKSHTGSATVTLVESNNFYALIKATGKTGPFQFVLYYTAYYGKPYVKIAHNFYYDNSNGSSSSAMNIGDVSLRLNTKVAGGTAAFGGSAGNITTTVSGADEAFLYYATEDNFIVRKGAASLGSGQGMSVLPFGETKVGWTHMTNSTIGVGACMRFMWQMFPKSLSVHGTGEIAAHLYSDKASAVTIYGGVGRTHFTGFAFTNSADMVKEMHYVITQPLMPVADIKWLTAQTKTFGEIGPCATGVFNPNPVAMINQYKMMGFIYGHAMRKVEHQGEHSYGFLAFGDLDDNRHGEGCAGRHWSNNYYDFPHCIAQAYLATGSEYNLETGLAHAMHLGDMDHSSVTGQSRTCPGWGHFGNYAQCAILLSGTANHYKCQGLFDWSCILGEPILGDIGLRVAKWAKGYPGGELRATGHVMLALAGAYGYSNDAQWKTSLENFISSKNMTSVATGANNFMQGIIGAGLMWTLIEIPGNADARNALKAWADQWTSSYNMTLHYVGDYVELSGGFLAGFGYAWHLFPDRHTAWQPAMQDQWNYWSTHEGATTDGRLKRHTEKFTRAPHYFQIAAQSGYNVYEPDYVTLTEPVMTAVEGREVSMIADHVTIEACPNPFKPSVKIAVSGLRITDSPVRIAIYNANGKIVDRLSATSHQLTTGLIWNASVRPAGLYLLKVDFGGRTLNKKLFLVK